MMQSSMLLTISSNAFLTDVVDESAALKTEILVLKRRNDILAKKEKRIQGIVTEWGKKVQILRNWETFVC